MNRNYMKLSKDITWVLFFLPSFIGLFGRKLELFQVNNRLRFDWLCALWSTKRLTFYRLKSRLKMSCSFDLSGYRLKLLIFGKQKIPWTILHLCSERKQFKENWGKYNIKKEDWRKCLQEKESLIKMLHTF